MLVLKKGTFLGNVTHLHCDTGTSVSATNYYYNDAEANSMHYLLHRLMLIGLSTGKIINQLSLQEINLTQLIPLSKEFLTHCIF